MQVQVAGLHEAVGLQALGLVQLIGEVRLDGDEAAENAVVANGPRRQHEDSGQGSQSKPSPGLASESSQRRQDRPGDADDEIDQGEESAQDAPGNSPPALIEGPAPAQAGDQQIQGQQYQPAIVSRLEGLMEIGQEGNQENRGRGAGSNPPSRLPDQGEDQQ